MRRGWSCRRGQEAAAVFLFGKSGDGACGACQTEKIWYNWQRIMPRRCAAKGDAMRIFVAGAGAWGTALAMLLEENGHAVTLWTRNAEKARKRRNRKRAHLRRNARQGLCAKSKNNAARCVRCLPDRAMQAAVRQHKPRKLCCMSVLT